MLRCGIPSCDSTTKLNGKTVIITGGNTGIGKETARDLTKRGARVILACRNMEKANLVAEEIKSDETVTGTVCAKQLDLASFESIRRFAKIILETEIHIDILINNAGLIGPKKKTEDGFDMVFGTNHLGHFLLTNLLLERIKTSAPSRIVVVSSDLHRYGTMHWDDLNLDKPNAYGPWKAYNQSKLANVLFVKELAHQLEGTGVTVYAVHPGIVKTDFNNQSTNWFESQITRTVNKLIAKTPVQGAQTTIYCAVDENLKDKSGFYYEGCRELTPARRAMNREDAKRLWAESLKMVQLDKSD